MMKSRKCIIQVYKIIKVMDRVSSDIFTILQNTRISIENRNLELKSGKEQILNKLSTLRRQRIINV